MDECLRAKMVRQITRVNAVHCWANQRKTGDLPENLFVIIGGHKKSGLTLICSMDKYFIHRRGLSKAIEGSALFPAG